MGHPLVRRRRGPATGSTAAGRGPLGPWDLTLDRVGPDPFDAGGPGPDRHGRWPVRLGGRRGLGPALAPRVARRPLAASASPRPRRPGRPDRAGSPTSSGVWRAEAGTIALPRGLQTLRAGGVLPLDGSPLRGTPAEPRAGPSTLALDLAGRGGRYTIPAEPVPLSGGGRLTLTVPLRHDPTPREALAMTRPRPRPTPSPPRRAADVPVTLVVELGRVNLTLGRLADLKPGDVVELGRHSREPVELTSGGRLVARGELVQIDTELGVRVTHVFL